MSRVLVSVLCALLVTVAHGASIYFNNSFDCAQGCSILDSAIYEGGVLPSDTDSVTFNATSAIQLYLHGNFTAGPLHIENNAVLTVQANAILTVQGILNVNHSSFIIATNGTVLVDGASIDNANLNISGTFSVVNNFLSSQSTVLGLDGSTFQVVGNLNFVSGTLNFSADASFDTLANSTFTGSQVTFQNTPSFTYPEFHRVTANLPAGFIVASSYVISSSNFAANLANLSTSIVTLSGAVILTAENLLLQSGQVLFGVGDNNEAAYISLVVQGNSIVNGPLSIPGEITVSTGSDVVLNGGITLSGGIQGEVNDSAKIHVVGSLTTVSPISLLGHHGHSTFTVSGTVTAPSITVSGKFSLDALSTSHLVGNVVNNGSVSASESGNFIVTGTFTQLPNGTFHAYNLSNTVNRTVNLIVNGSAFIDGNIKFNSTERKNEFTAIVLEASEHLNGTFIFAEFFGDDINKFTYSVAYSTNSVKVTVKPPSSSSTKKYFGLEYWVWIIIGGGILLALILFVAIIIRMRRRSKYEIVRE